MWGAQGLISDFLIPIKIKGSRTRIGPSLQGSHGNACQSPPYPRLLPPAALSSAPPPLALLTASRASPPFVGVAYIRRRGCGVTHRTGENGVMSGIPTATIQPAHEARSLATQGAWRLQHRRVCIPSSCARFLFYLELKWRTDNHPS